MEHERVLGEVSPPSRVAFRTKFLLRVSHGTVLLLGKEEGRRGAWEKENTTSRPIHGFLAKSNFWA